MQQHFFLPFLVEHGENSYPSQRLEPVCGSSKTFSDSFPMELTAPASALKIGWFLKKAVPTYQYLLRRGGGSCTSRSAA
jgi:hypothetical protein